MTVEQAEVRYPATPASLRELHDWVCDRLQRAAAGRPGGLPADWVHSVEAATAELASNIVRHAYRDTSGDLRCRIVL